jgi:hypothetical protein
MKSKEFSQGGYRIKLYSRRMFSDVPLVFLGNISSVPLLSVVGIRAESGSKKLLARSV